MRCPKCWNDVPERSAYCLHCGHEIAATQVTARPVEPIRPTAQPARGWTPGMIVLVVLAASAGLVGSVALILSSANRSAPIQQAQKGNDGQRAASPVPTPTPMPTPTTRAVVVNVPPPPQAPAARITFAPGEVSAVVRGSKRDFESKDYYLRARAGQEMRFEVVSQQDMVLQVLDVTTDALVTSGTPKSGRLILPTTGDYQIRVLGPAGTYTLGVSVE